MDTPGYDKTFCLIRTVKMTLQQGLTDYRAP
jgi:hypothetical protein